MKEEDKKSLPVDAEDNIDRERSLPYRLVRRIVTLALAFGLIGGAVGGYFFLRFIPEVIPTSKQSVLLEQNSAAIDVAKRVSPSVVSITSESTGFSFFGSAQTTKGAGTGIIATSDGLIITNNHVIEGAQNLSVFTSDGKEYKDAQVIARDPSNDLAYLRITAKNLKPAELGDSSQVKVGTSVLAIGNALGQYQNTVTEGIVSGLGRPVTAGDEAGASRESLQNLIQTDAAINPGNSGGPLVDLTGKVIGINTAVAGNAQGIGFAIPVNLAKAQLRTVREQGKIIRPYLGVRYIPVTKELASARSLPVNYGAYLSGSEGAPAVVDNSPAARAGLKDGDIITKINNQKLDETHPLSAEVSQKKPGDKIKVAYLRDGKEQTTDITLEEAPATQ